MQQRVFGRGRLERAVGVPQAVADREQPPPIVAGERLVVLVEVRDIGKRRWETVFARQAQARPDRQLDLAETAGEGELLLVIDVLIAEDEDSVPVHTGMNVGDLFRRERPAHVDAFDLTGETWADLADPDGHWRAFFDCSSGMASCTANL